MSASTKRASREKKAARQGVPVGATGWLPKKTNGLDHAFGPSRISDYLPARSEIPEDFMLGHGPWPKLIHRWFFEGLKGVNLVPKPGVDKSEAIGHCATIMRSFEPQHEHKIGGVAYLMSLWFEPLDEKAGER